MDKLRFAILSGVLSVLALGNASAERILIESENAYELSLNMVILPRSSAGSIIFRACDSCRPKTHLVNTETTYVVGRQQLELAAFLTAVKAIERSRYDRTPIYVFYDTASLDVTRIVLGSF